MESQYASRFNSREVYWSIEGWDIDACMPKTQTIVYDQVIRSLVVYEQKLYAFQIIEKNP